MWTVLELTHFVNLKSNSALISNVSNNFLNCFSPKRCRLYNNTLILTGLEFYCLPLELEGKQGH